MIGLWILAGLGTAWADTLRVGAGGYGSIQAAVSAASAGDVIEIDAGTWAGGVTVSKSLTILGNGTVIVEARDKNLFDVTGGTVILGAMTLRPDGGRGVRVTGGTVSLVSLVIEGNDTTRDAFDGAAVAVIGSADVTLRGCTLSGNTAELDLGVGAQGYGGHLLIDGTSRDATHVSLEDTDVRDGDARNGGAIYATSATLTLTDTTFDGHVARFGGGVLVGDDLALTLDGVTVTDGRSTGSRADGGCLQLSNSATTVTDTSLTTCTATGDGGAILAAGGSLALTRVALTGARAAAGGGVRAEAGTQVTATDVALCDSNATTQGSAWWVGDGADATFVRVSSVFDRGGEGAWWFDGAGTTATLDHVDLLDARGARGLVAAGSASLDVTNTLVAWATGTGIDAPGATLDWVALFGNGTPTSGGTTLGTGPVTTDPRLTRFVRNDVCGDEILYPAPDSPLVDAGDPTELDPDGSRTDIGVAAGAGADEELFEDDDSDGFLALYDCNDVDNSMKPGGTELCDDKDNDCDGVVDGPNPVAASTWYADDDDDGFGRQDTVVTACDAPPKHAATFGDCDDTNGAVNPSATEVCNGLDDDCRLGADGTDAQGQLTWYADTDGDGHGAPGSSFVSCAGGDGYVLSSFDCDDTRADVGPDTAEVCDGVDQDCDGAIDSPDPTDGWPWVYDEDDDGFGGEFAATVIACRAPDGFVREGGDCDDASDGVHPRADEACDTLIDTNCDGYTGRVDADGDGYGACEECDDGDADTYPGAPDTPYDGVVTDCDATSDFDADGDGADSAEYGGTDCDDDDASISPAADDAPADGVDQDCDGRDSAADDTDGTANPPPGCEGCTTTGTDAGGAVAATFLALTLRRRRTPPASRQARA